jgi:atypical dual specificity phosphatase
MPMPMIHVERRENFGGPLAAFEDDLPLLVRAGIGSVVSLLNIPSDAAVYASAGLGYLCLPIPDGYAPSLEQMLEFLRFEREQRELGRVVAVHCAAGLGRTGTVLAGYVIADGCSAESAIARIRTARRGAIETSEQVRFLHNLPAALVSAGFNAL